MSTTKIMMILGATGFIGRNMVEKFSQDPSWRVRAVYHKRPLFTHPNVEWVQCDLKNEEQVKKLFSGVDVVVQAAATTTGAKDAVNTPFLHVTDNAVMNSYIFRSCHESSVKHVVFFSCSVMYPVNRPSVQETDVTMDGIHPRYFGVGWTKVYLEKMAEFYARLGNTRFTVIRHSNIYGPHDKYDLERSHVFGATMTKLANALRDKKEEIVVWGQGKELRDLLHVDDLGHFIDLAVKKQQESFMLCNVGCGKGISINDLVMTMQQEMGGKLKLQHDLTKPSIPVDIVLNSDRAHAFGWKPTIALPDGIRRTWQWYQKNIL